MTKIVPVNTPLFDGNELKYVSECIETGWVSSEGRFVSEFEKTFSAYVNRKYGIAVSSGSAALDIAVAAIGISAGDEVIMPAFTIISPALSVVRAGGVPVLLDSDPATFNMDVSGLEKKITPRTKAIIVVHVYGLPVDMDPVLELCERYGLYLIEDAAEMLGQTYKGKICGSFGHISIFSFYPNKNITTGEGGMIVCDEDKIHLKCKKLRNLAFEPDKARFVHYETGWNYRMSNLQAALGLAQIEKIDAHLEHKKIVGELYREGLAGIPGFQLSLDKTSFAENIWWVFCLVADSENLKNGLVRYLEDAGIATRPFFWSMHEQPVFLEKGFFAAESYPVAERLARNGIYLPGGLGISLDEVRYVIQKIWEYPKG